MKVVFDAEPLIAFAFDEPGAGYVEDLEDNSGNDVTLLIGADDDYDDFQQAISSTHN